VQNVHRILESHGVNRAKSVTVVVLNDLEYARPAKSLEWLCMRWLIATLSQVKRVTDVLHYWLGKAKKILFATGNPNKRLRRAINLYHFWHRFFGFVKIAWRF